MNEIPISSADNAHIKFAVKLRQRRIREKEKLIPVEGFEELQFAVEAGVRLQALYYCPQLVRQEQTPLLAKAAPGRTPVYVIGPKLMEKISYRENPDAWFALVSGVGPTDCGQNHLDLLHTHWKNSNCLILVAEDLEKPGNLGAIFRTADAVGAGLLSVSAGHADSRGTDVSNPNVVRASKGCIFTVPWASLSNEEALAWLRERGIAVLAADPAAQTLHWQADLRGSVALVIGAESRGLSAFWKKEADRLVRLQMNGRVNSLNAATAAAIFAYEALRQRESTGLEALK